MRYNHLSKNGNINLESPVWDDMRVAMTATKRGESKQPGFVKFKDDDSGSQGIFLYHFDKATEEELYFEVQLPHSMKEGTELRPHIHWAKPTDTTGDVIWGLEYTMAGVGDTWEDTTIIKTDATPATTDGADIHMISAFPSISTSDINLSGMICCRLFRDATNVLDTYDADAATLEFDFHYQIDALGSFYEYNKHE